MKDRALQTAFVCIASMAVAPAGWGAASPLEGVWASDGFGYLLAVSGRTLTAFEVTATTCVPSFTAQQKSSHSHGILTFQSKDEAFRFRPGSTAGTWLLRLEETLADITLRPIKHLPAVCETPTQNTPEGNFEVFAQTWAENYISFQRRGVDWNAVVAEHRPRVTAATTAAELFDVLRAMIERFGDRHTYLSAPSLNKSTKVFWRLGTDRILGGDLDAFAQTGRWKIFSAIDQRNLQRQAQQVCQQGLQFGDLGGQMGYLRIRSFGNYAKSNDARALEGCLDAIFRQWKIRSLVIDLRLAFGGSDELGLVIARRLTSEPYLAYMIQARSNGPHGWAPQQPVLVQPSPRPGFRGPIAVLTGPVTLRAAESFVLALMGRQPPTTRIGESTQGVFCDVLTRRLPNGWSFGLPNSVYSTADGRIFEATGIPPDIAVPVFSDADLRAGKDPAMDAARLVLTQR